MRPVPSGRAPVHRCREHGVACAPERSLASAADRRCAGRARQRRGRGRDDDRRSRTAMTGAGSHAAACAARDDRACRGRAGVDRAGGASACIGGSRNGASPASARATSSTGTRLSGAPNAGVPGREDLGGEQARHRRRVDDHPRQDDRALGIEAQDDGVVGVRHDRAGHVPIWRHRGAAATGGDPNRLLQRGDAKREVGASAFDQRRAARRRWRRGAAAWRCAAGADAHAPASRRRCRYAAARLAIEQDVERHRRGFHRGHNSGNVPATTVDEARSRKLSIACWRASATCRSRRWRRSTRNPKAARARAAGGAAA